MFFSQYPGWTLKADGSLVMATVNEDAAGTYVCTPYNSYGSMGPSGLTNVILQVSLHVTMLFLHKIKTRLLVRNASKHLVNATECVLLLPVSSTTF